MKRTRALILVATMVGAVLVVTAGPAHAIDFTVNSTVDAPDAHMGDKLCASAAGKCTLRAAIMEVNALAKTSSNVKIPAGTYTLTVQGAGEDQGATGDLDLRVTMNISAASGTPVIKGGSGFGDRIFDIPAGTAPAIYMVGILVSNGTAPAATHEDGGGIRDLGGGSLIIQNSTISGSTATGGSGGGLYAGGSAGSTITVNGATGLTLTGDSAADNGGGMDMEGATVADVKTLTISSDSAANGGGLAAFLDPGTTGSAQVRFSTMTGNSTTAGGSGGGLAVARTHLSHLTVSGNTAGFGGGMRVYPSSIPTVIEGRIALSENTATADGGGLYVSGCGAACSVVDLEVDQNTATRDGGGIYVSGAFTLAGTTLYRNNTLGRGTAGGSLFHTGPTGQPLSVTNVTITENTGGPATSGMAITSAATDVLTNDTIANNTGGTAKAIAVTGGGAAPQLKNVVASSTGANCSGPITSLGHNLDSGNSCGFRKAGDLVSADPKLGAWTDTGGFTKTMRPQWTSPIIDAGDPNGCPTTDQRVVSRPQIGISGGDAICDIGAYEISQWVRNSAVGVTLTGSPSGSIVTYTIALSNTAGDGATKNSVLTDDLPVVLGFVSCSATGGGVCGGSGNHRTVTWSGIAIGATPTATIVAQVLRAVPRTTLIVNSVRVSADNPDLWAWDNTYTSSISL